MSKFARIGKKPSYSDGAKPEKIKFPSSVHFIKAGTCFQYLSSVIL